MPGEGGVVTTLARLVEVLGRSVLEVPGSGDRAGAGRRGRAPADPGRAGSGGAGGEGAGGRGRGGGRRPGGGGAPGGPARGPVDPGGLADPVGDRPPGGAGSSGRGAAGRPVRHRRRGGHPDRWPGDHRGPPVTAARVLREPEQPPAERQRAFTEAAEVVALQILRQRAQADVERLPQADLVISIVRGDAGAADAINRLGLTARAYRVLAVRPKGPTPRPANRPWFACGTSSPPTSPRSGSEPPRPQIGRASCRERV